MRIVSNKPIRSCWRRVMNKLAPGSVIGILGGGQLGRMTALAAANLGYRCHIFTPEQNSPAQQVCDRVTIADYRDGAALVEFAQHVDVVTLEFENVPVETLAALSTMVPVRPSPKVLGICQDRLLEKRFANQLGLKTVKWRAVDSVEALQQALIEIPPPCVLKTTRFGYDGKGQVKITDDQDLVAIWQSLKTDQAILEEFVALEREISVIVARGIDGSICCYEPAENHHENHILAVTTLPAQINDQQRQKAMADASHLAESLDVIGLLSVEMFVLTNGDLVINEMAPRPHNSGHWTQDAAFTSQFEQLVRAVCGLPLGNPARRCDVTMHNLIGDQIDHWPDFMAESTAKLHLYGKSESRPGRKMGHVNRLWPDGLPDDR